MWVARRKNYPGPIIGIWLGVRPARLWTRASMVSPPPSHRGSKAPKLDSRLGGDPGATVSEMASFSRPLAFAISRPFMQLSAALASILTFTRTKEAVILKIEQNGQESCSTPEGSVNSQSVC